MLLRTVLLVIVMLAGPVPASAKCDPPSSAIGDWPVAMPEDVGLDSEPLCSIVSKYQDYVHAILVARHGRLVFERYFTGTDHTIGSEGKSRSVVCDAVTLHDIRSITKGITALVFGIAIDRGLIGGIDTPVLSFFPEFEDLRTEEKSRITLAHLLTMTPGLAWKRAPWLSRENGERQMWESARPSRYALEQPMVSRPGEKFSYTGGPTAILADILQKRTGQTLEKLAKAWLFDPLGIADVEWVRVPPHAEVMADGGLRMRPRDLAKIGQLLLDRGRWNGLQVVSEGWIEESTRRQTRAQSGLDYGYQFWIGRSFLDKLGDVPWVVGLGWGGQRLFVVPSLDMVVVIHAGLYDNPLHGTLPEAILNRFILPAAEK
jgi:CubicO group peptidase (beta-lactamase class C family)